MSVSLPGDFGIEVLRIGLLLSAAPGLRTQEPHLRSTCFSPFPFRSIIGWRSYPPRPTSIQETFGVSSQTYSFFFAIWAVGLAIGPQIYMRLSREWERTSIITGCFVVTVLSGLLVFLWATLGPGPSYRVVSKQHRSQLPASPSHLSDVWISTRRDAGSTSALMNSSHDGDGEHRDGHRLACGSAVEWS